MGDTAGSLGRVSGDTSLAGEDPRRSGDDLRLSSVASRLALETVASGATGGRLSRSLGIGIQDLFPHVSEDEVQDCGMEDRGLEVSTFKLFPQIVK